MDQSTGRGGGRVIGEYSVGRQLGSGSFSVVWHGRHRVHGTEVAIKEIAMDRLNKKLQESLRSEIFILKQINHPNIIRLHDIIEASGRIHLVLEYCRGGDLYMYIHRHKRVPEATAKHFMQQLASGLKVLRENNLIHRDLKPQNLLLSSIDENSVLKIADFGFARSLQPRGLAETMCGSPLYMAPEIMQLQKYDAKADLWSVGAILFQLVTGITPFTGNNQIQLLDNIIRSTELRFPTDITDLSLQCVDLCKKLLRRNPVERLTFDEFFNHPFLSYDQPDEMSQDLSTTSDHFPLPECTPSKSMEGSSPDDCLPFLLDDDSSGPDGSPSYFRRSAVKSSGCSPEPRKEAVANASKIIGISSRSRYITSNVKTSGFRINNRSADVNTESTAREIDQRGTGSLARAGDAPDLIDQDYVLVPGPSLDMPSSSTKQSSGKPESASIRRIIANPKVSSPVPIVGTSTRAPYPIGSLESQCSDPPGTSQGSADFGDISEQQSTNSLTRIKSFQKCAATIKELVDEKMEVGRHLEAFSIQLVILAIWKQALHICHTEAASSMVASPSSGTAKFNISTEKKYGTPNSHECLDIGNSRDLEDLSSEIKREFFKEVGHAEELSKFVEPGNIEMPDAMETIYQSALALGRNGAVDDLMGDMGNAALSYSKAVQLLVFLLVEAPSLLLNPPFSLTKSDQFRLRTYINILSDRQGLSRSQRIAFLRKEDQQ